MESVIDLSTCSSDSSSGNGDLPTYESLMVEQKEIPAATTGASPNNADVNGNNHMVQLGSVIGELRSTNSLISDSPIAATGTVTEASLNEIQVENENSSNILVSSSPAEHIISRGANLMSIDIYEDDDMFEDEYDVDEDDDDDDEDDDILTSAIVNSHPSTVQSEENAAADAQAESITAKMRQYQRESVRRAYAEMLAGVDENGIAEEHARIIAAARTRLGSIKATSAISSSASAKFVIDSSKKSPSPGVKYDRKDFLLTMQDNGSRSPLNVVINENFELTTEELEDLVENLNWMFGDIDDLFCLPKLELEKLEYSCMVKFTAGDYVMQSKSLKCRDREHFLKYKPMEVICSHYLYCMTLLLLKKPANAYQVIEDMKASVSFIKSTSNKEDAPNNHSLSTVFDFLVKNCEIFFNYVTGRTAFEGGDLVPSVDAWNTHQRLYLSLACFITCDSIGKPMDFELEAFIEGILYENIFMVEWGLRVLETLKSVSNRSKCSASFKSLIIGALKKEDARCENPFLFQYAIDYLPDAGITDTEKKCGGLMIKFRNFINSYGTVVRVRLDVVAMLESFPSSPERNNLIRSCLEKAVAINPLHPDANYRLAMYYFSKKLSEAPLCVRYLKASLAVDSSRFEAVMEYCQLLMGKQFRLLSTLSSTQTSSHKTVETAALDGHGHLCTLDVPSVIVGFASGVGAKFWTKTQAAELNLLIFYSLMMTGADDEALEILLPIYHHNKIISNMRNVHVVRAKYGWASTRVTLKHMVYVFIETYHDLRQKEEEDKLTASNKPSSSTVARKKTAADNMKTMLKTLISYFKDDLP